MQQTVRIIPRLDIKGPNLVKGIHLEGLRVLGGPEQFARYYYEQGADELFYMDVVASLYERNSLHQMISQIAKNIFIPITVGGGLRSVKDINDVLKAGADKVCINTAAIRKPEFIREASRQFGSSTIVVAIEAIKQSNGKYLCFVDNGREHTGVEVSSWAKEIEDLGAGEIVVTSVDREGTGEGFDRDLIQLVTSSVNIPVVAHGGADSKEGIADTISACKVAAVALASVLHYDVVERKLVQVPDKKIEGNTTFISAGQGFKKIKSSNIPEIKAHLLACGIECRP